MIYRCPVGPGDRLLTRFTSVSLRSARAFWVAVRLAAIIHPACHARLHNAGKSLIDMY
ncbi:hypothetical protein JI735_14990 [Paenibacillus sonchi]|uniref:Uncharacterized protein n=1 Tax=Paenibacillus sonchi TaxID=373687 RepID=A0A974PH24_9BACL|nr:hypothetical protein [Paenibacillus sonchi]QQZ63635.1 hypothetical protein JI735_14990 [Paenibacillus sonchi]